MACCCKSDRCDKVAISCLGRCDLPRHQCLDREDVRPGPIPKNMGWLYTARTAPEHQLRCGWRPGHISCAVLRRIERLSCTRCGEFECASCSPSSCSKPCGKTCLKPCYKPCCATAPKYPPCAPSSCDPPCSQPLVRIVRHAGQYSIITEPKDVSNHPSGKNPLKYVLNTHPDDIKTDNKVKFKIEAKFNDYRFDYTSSDSSFILDFSPPESGCLKL